MNTLDIALDLWDHGYNPFPVIPGEKRPPVKWKELQSRRVTEEEIRSWWSKGNPNRWNIANICGEISGCVVVDADSPEAITYCKLNLPPTPYMVLTRKGMHFYYKHPGFKIQSKARVIDDPPIDIRADGGIAVAIGSIHTSGYVYQLGAGSDVVSPSDLPLYQSVWFPPKDLPVVNINRVQATSDSAKRAEKYLQIIPHESSGNRNRVAFRVACILSRDFGLDYDQGLGLLSKWNDGNSPPLTDTELITTYKSSMVSGSYPIGGKL
jgi:hypothetical protein